MKSSMCSQTDSCVNEAFPTTGASHLKARSRVYQHDGGPSFWALTPFPSSRVRRRAACRNQRGQQLQAPHRAACPAMGASEPLSNISSGVQFPAVHRQSRKGSGFTGEALQADRAPGVAARPVAVARRRVRKPRGTPYWGRVFNTLFIRQRVNCARVPCVVLLKLNPQPTQPRSRPLTLKAKPRERT